MMMSVQGRHLLWGWLQERRKVGSYNYAGCLSVPRVLHLRGDRLIQEPAPEVAGLRREQILDRSHIIVRSDAPTPLISCEAGLAVELCLQLERCDALSVPMRV